MSLASGSPTPQATPTLSLEDIQLLALVGKDIDYAFKTVVAEFAVYGVYFILASMALHIVIKRPLRTARSRLLGSLLIATFLLTTLSCSLDIVYMQARIHPVVTVDDPSISFSEEVQGYGKSSRLKPIFIMTSIMETGGDVGLVFILNDILAAWRAMSVWAFTSRPFVGALLYFLIFATIGLWIPAVVLDSQMYGASATSNADIFAILAIVGSSTSIAANALATGMIGYVAYSHRLIETGGRVKLASSRILALLAESGLLYGVIQIIRLALSVSIVPSTPLYGSLMTATSIFSSVTKVVTAMYTPAIILIISLGYSIEDTVRFGSSFSETDTSGLAPAQGRRRPSPRTVSNIVFGRNQRSEGAASSVSTTGEMLRTLDSRSRSGDTGRAGLGSPVIGEQKEKIDV